MAAQRITPAGESNGSGDAGSSYTLPVVHVRIPEKVVNTGFWGALAGTAVFGVIDPPLAALIGAGVVIARHRSRRA